MSIQFTPLAKFQERVKDYAADFSDARSKTPRFTFGQNNELSFETNQSELIAGRTIGTLNEWAFNQVANRLDAPAQWLTGHCPEPLRIEILNQLSQVYRKESDLLIRMKGDVIRAVLSDQYSIFDNLELIDLVAKAVETMGIEPQICRSQVDDDMRAYVVFPAITFAPDPDHPNDGGLHPAIYTANSERGGGCARIHGAVFRSFCTNGMIVGWTTKSQFELRHRFHSKAAMGLLVAEGISAALEMSEEATKKFIDAQAEEIPVPSLHGLVDRWATTYGLSLPAKENWLSAISTEQVQNARKDSARLFDVINAATFIAQTRSADEAEVMERMAGDLLYNRLPSTTATPAEE